MISFNKITFGLLTVFCLNSFAAFEDIGESRRDCENAKVDALQMAKSNCASLETNIDTKQNKARISGCKKDKSGFYKVKVTYKCDIEAVSDDGYQDFVDETVDTYL